ncbi:MAG: hypothetical protein ACRERY_14880 [Pseudomonas sp.]
MYRSTYLHTLEQLREQLSFAHAVLANELQDRRQAQSALADLIAKDFSLLGELADLVASPAPEQQPQSLSAALESFAARSRASSRPGPNCSDSTSRRATIAWCCSATGCCTSTSRRSSPRGRTCWAGW